MYYRSAMNLAVLMLMEDGTLAKMKLKWWKDKSTCNNEGKVSDITLHCDVTNMYKRTNI